MHITDTITVQLLTVKLNAVLDLQKAKPKIDTIVSEPRIRQLFRCPQATCIKRSTQSTHCKADENV